MDRTEQLTGQPGASFLTNSPDHSLEIACDESGLEGENLVGGNTDVFAHASVRIGIDEAAEWIQDIRGRIRSPAREYHANHLLREKHRNVLEWFLGPSGPIYGNAHVQLVDKSYFVVSNLVTALVEDKAEAGDRRRTSELTDILYRNGPAAFGLERWQTFLESANRLLRTKERTPQPEPPEASFFRQVDSLSYGDTFRPIDAVLGALRQARPRASELRTRLLDDSMVIPPLDPLIPAIVRTVEYWSTGGTPILIIHDEHNSLTSVRIRRLTQMLDAGDQLSPDGSSAAQLFDLQLVDSRSDARVQLADFLAGIARKISSDELNQRGDRELTDLLSPYVGETSIWGDDRSWSRLSPSTGAPKMTS